MEGQAPVAPLGAVPTRRTLSPAPLRASGLRPGQLLAQRYELLELVAHGGTSRIFRARDLESVASGAGDPLVAVKVAHESTAELARELVRHEALIARQLNHPGIPRIHDFAQHGDVWFLTMEWVVGTPLESLLGGRRRPLPPKQAERLLDSVAQALGHAHARGIVHGDVKPGNILVDRHGGTRLLDWTTARYVAGRERVPLSSMATPAFDGFSPGYASPQARQGGTINPADDVYSLACVAYRLLTGQAPGRASQRRLRALPAMTVRARLLQVVERGMSAEPTRRHRSPESLANALREARRRPARLALAGATACLIAGALVPGYMAHQKYRDDQQALAAVRQGRSNSAALRTELDQAHAEHLPGLLTAASGLPEPWRSASLRRMRSPVLATMQHHVNSELAAVHSAATLDALDALLAAAAAHYPDSAMLEALAERVAAARERHTRARLAALRRLWEQSAFTREQGRRIAEATAALRQTGIDTAGALPDTARDRFNHALDEALGAGNLRQVGQLAAFRAAVAAKYPDLADQRRAALLAAARALLDFERAGGRQGRFPVGAAERFYQAHFEQLRSSMNASWSTPVLVAIKKRLDRLAARLPAGFEPLRALQQRLARRLRAKARYYAGIGNDRRAGYYNRLVGELLRRH